MLDKIDKVGVAGRNNSFAIRSCTFLLFLLIKFIGIAQEYKVASLETVKDDIEARLNSREDLNGNKCALLKVYVNDGISHVNGSVIGNIISKGMEKHIYLSPDSKQIELVFENHLPLKIKFEDYKIEGVKGQTVYAIKLIESPSSSNPDDTWGTKIPKEISLDKLSGAIEYYKNEKFDKAFSLFMEVKDNATAQYYLGIMYENGRGVAQDYKEAFQWYQRSALQGNYKAQNNVAGLYKEGHGVIQDNEEAARWYLKAATQGDPVSQTNLGIMYFNGQGVTKDYKEAAKWFTRAAEQGYSRAQANLATMYEHGLGVTQDYNAAIQLYEKAIQQGNKNAQKPLDELKKKLK